MKKEKIRKILRPQDVTVLIDRREQCPVDVSPLKSMPATLATGDYGILGLENLVAIERKGLQDLVMCVGRERDRFEKEIQRLLAYETRAIVVEGNWALIESKQYRGLVEPNSIIGSCLSWMARGIPVLMADNHERAGRYISRLLFTAARRRYNENLAFFETTTEQEIVA